MIATGARSRAGAVAAWVLTALASISIATPDAARETTRIDLSDQAMGTTFSVVIHGRDRARLERAGRAALDEAQRLDRLLSNYRPDSEWSEVNRSAAERPVRVSRELFELVAASVGYSRLSDGAFDLTVGPLMRVWGFFKGEGTLPDRADVAAALPRVGFRHVRLDRRHMTIRFDVPGLELDPGGIGKGYAVDRMVAVLKGYGISCALVSAGGSSIYGLGAPPDAPQGWPITIRSPTNPRETAARVTLRNMSLSTSGSYEKFFRANGRLYAHIMDPRTGAPAEGAVLVSVVAPATIESEVWTKPYFINGREWTATHQPKTFRVFYCDSQTPPVCGWINRR